MMEFMKKMMDWALEKEDDLAKNCGVKPEDIDKQIKIMEEKREQLKLKFEENDAEFKHILSRLNTIKADASQCTMK